jgi:hypothetical protein
MLSTHDIIIWPFCVGSCLDLNNTQHCVGVMAAKGWLLMGQKSSTEAVVVKMVFMKQI